MVDIWSHVSTMIPTAEKVAEGTLQRSQTQRSLAQQLHPVTTVQGFFAFEIVVVSVLQSNTPNPVAKRCKVFFQSSVL